MYKVRVKKKDQLDPYLLLALLNAPIVKRQMRAKQFTRDVIDTLGKRIYEIVLPIPKDTVLRDRIARDSTIPYWRALPCEIGHGRSRLRWKG